MLKKIKEIQAWADKKENWVSALLHGGIVAVWMTIGLIIAALQYLATGDAEMAVRIIVFFSGGGIGAYLLREGDDASKAIGEEDEGKKLGEGFEDLIAPIIVAVALGVIYSGFFG